LACEDYRYSQPYSDPQLSLEQTEILNRQTNYLSKKSFYPYKWLDEPQKLHYENLPAQECFFNDLTDEGISSENYQFCQTIWDEFEMCKFEDYHLLYNLIDVLILTDILIYFRQLIRQDYNLDCFKFFSMPGLAFKGALKRSGIEIQLLTDMDQHLFGNFFSFNFFLLTFFKMVNFFLCICVSLVSAFASTLLLHFFHSGKIAPRWPCPMFSKIRDTIERSECTPFPTSFRCNVYFFFFKRITLFFLCKS